MTKKFFHVFGPVPSRRLGRSLGVDLVPHKVCSYDCIYCQIGRTTRKTMLRQEYVSAEAVLSELSEKLDAGLEADYITLSGSGEPTLNSRCGRILRGIKEITATPVAVITNGSLLWDPQVREELAGADLVVPSLDAGEAEIFRKINRPVQGLDFQKMVQGLIDFCAGFSGETALEIFILDRLTSEKDQAKKMARLVREIDPDRIQLNTVVRPPAEDYALGLTKEEMMTVAELFGERAEVIVDYKLMHESRELKVACEEVLDVLRRRPLSLEDLAVSLGTPTNQALKLLESLIASGEVLAQQTAGRIYYVPVDAG